MKMARKNDARTVVVSSFSFKIINRNNFLGWFFVKYKN